MEVAFPASFHCSSIHWCHLSCSFLTGSSLGLIGKPIDLLTQNFEVNQSLMCINYQDLEAAVGNFFTSVSYTYGAAWALFKQLGVHCWRERRAGRHEQGLASPASKTRDVSRPRYCCACTGARAQQHRSLFPDEGSTQVFGQLKVLQPFLRGRGVRTVDVMKSLVSPCPNPAAGCGGLAGWMLPKLPGNGSVMKLPPALYGFVVLLCTVKQIMSFTQRNLRFTVRAMILYTHNISLYGVADT